MMRRSALARLALSVVTSEAAAVQIVEKVANQWPASELPEGGAARAQAGDQQACEFMARATWLAGEDVPHNVLGDGLSADPVHGTVEFFRFAGQSDTSLCLVDRWDPRTCVYPVERLANALGACALADGLVDAEDLFLLDDSELPLEPAPADACPPHGSDPHGIARVYGPGLGWPAAGDEDDDGAAAPNADPQPDSPTPRTCERRRCATRARRA